MILGMMLEVLLFQNLSKKSYRSADFLFPLSIVGNMQHLYFFSSEWFKVKCRFKLEGFIPAFVYVSPHTTHKGRGARIFPHLVNPYLM